MIPTEQIAVLRLAEFMETRFDPALRAANRPGQGWLESLAMGEFFEAVWWLLAGTGIGYFPPVQVSEVWQDLSAEIGEKLYEYIFSSKDFYAPALIDRLRQRLEDGWVVTAGIGEPGDPAAAIFETGLLLSRSLQNDRLSRLSSAAMLFAPTTDWEHLNLSSTSGAALAEALSGSGVPETISPALLLAGLWRSFDHMAASKLHMESIDLNFVDERMPEYRQINAWRFNFTSSLFENRFREAQDALIALAASAPEASETKLGEKLRNDFLVLAKAWNEHHPFLLADVAGA